MSHWFIEGAFTGARRKRHLPPNLDHFLLERELNMHFIQSAAIPPVVKTAVSGVSTPSSVGQVFLTDAHWVVSWNDFDGPHSIIAATPERVIEVVDTIAANTDVTLFNVERVA